LLHFRVFCKSTARYVFLEVYKELEIIGAVGRVIQIFTLTGP